MPDLFELIDCRIREDFYAEATVVEHNGDRFCVELSGGGRCWYWSADHEIGLYKRRDK